MNLVHAIKLDSKYNFLYTKFFLSEKAKEPRYLRKIFVTSLIFFTLSKVHIHTRMNLNTANGAAQSTGYKLPIKL